MGANDPWGVASLYPRGLIGRIDVADHESLLHTKHVSCGPHGFREDIFFKVFPIISQWELYIGMAAILIYGPWQFVQIFIFL